MILTESVDRASLALRSLERKKERRKNNEFLKKRKKHYTTVADHLYGNADQTTRSKQLNKDEAQHSIHCDDKACFFFFSSLLIKRGSVQRDK